LPDVSKVYMLPAFLNRFARFAAMAFTGNGF
jgi:hypothetical protein